MVMGIKVPPKRRHRILEDCNLDTQCHDSHRFPEMQHAFREVRPELWKSTSLSLRFISTSCHDDSGPSGGPAPRILNLRSYLLTYGTGSFVRSCQLCRHSRMSQDVKEPEGSSPCPQKPSTGPYPERDRSSPYHPFLSLSISISMALPSFLLELRRFFSFFNPIHSRQDSFDGGSACRKAALSAQNNTNTR
jgi:hypothetical protein